MFLSQLATNLIHFGIPRDPIQATKQALCTGGRLTFILPFLEIYDFVLGERKTRLHLTNISELSMTRRRGNKFHREKMS